MKSIFVYLLLAFAAAVAPSAARAQFHVGPIASGAGGAGRAAADPSESAFLNPAALSHLRHYNVAVGYQATEHPTSGGRTEYSAQISDANEDRIVPGALAFAHRFVEPSRSGGSYTEQDFALAASGFVFNGFSAGVGAHRQLYKPSRGSDEAQNNVTLGTLWAIRPTLGLAAVVYDVLPTGLDASVPSAVRQAPTYALGAMGNPTELLRLRFDLVRPTEGQRNGRTNVMAGFESQFRGSFLFRAGTQWRETEDKHLVTAGLGFHGPRLSFDYAYEKDVRVEGGVRHFIDLWMPL